MTGDGGGEDRDDGPATAAPGWYDDPFRTGWVRWFDGTAWTTHALSADEPRPDHVVEDRWDGHTGDGHTGDDARAAGVGGPPKSRAARLGTRIGPKGVVHLARYLGAVTVLLVVLAAGDPRHRALLAVLALGFLVATVVVAVREARDRARWRRLGDEP